LHDDFEKIAASSPIADVIALLFVTHLFIVSDILPHCPYSIGVSWGGQRAAAARAAAAAAVGAAPTSPTNNGSSTSRSHRQQQMYNEAAEVGPAAYAPSIGVNRPTAPRAKFGTASRFGSGAFAEHPPTIYHPQWNKTERAAPSYSIGPPVAVEERGLLRSERTFFMTHNVAGGLARAATLEDGVGTSTTIYCFYL
jgi:hypothetical protein